MLMTTREIERALLVGRETFPASTECAICGLMWVQHNGEICPICSICGVHGLQHSTLPPVEKIEIRERSDYYWHLCRGGTQTFVPMIDIGPMYFDPGN